MRKELRRYSSIGNKAGILLLCKKVLTGRMEVLSSIGASCSFINGVELNFKCGIIAFEDIGLISVSDGKCIAKDILYTAQSESAFLEHLCRYCMNALIQMDLIQIDYLKYNELKDAFQIPMYAFNFECAVYRNMLITFGALVPEGALFTINDKFEEDFTKYVSKKRTISQEQLLTKIEQERIIGEKGEAFVLSFEKKRCSFTYKQLKRIKQISIVDASAGYDILSFENEISDAKRYIEVKTYCGKVHFFWSANEIEAARLRGAAYFLYLVDYNKIDDDGYKPLIISNPYANIKDMTIWDMLPSSYAIKTDLQEEDLKVFFQSEIQSNTSESLSLNKNKLDNIEDDRDIRNLVYNRLIMNAETSDYELQREVMEVYGHRYPDMKILDWERIIRDYTPLVREAAKRPNVIEMQQRQYGMAAEPEE